jgi:hypothetical protein
LLRVTPVFHNIVGDDTSMTFSISNGGEQTLEWSCETTSAWIASVEPASGTGASDVTVTVDPSAVGPGSYGGAVEVTSNGGSEAVIVAINASDLFVCPLDIDLGTSSTTATVNVRQLCGGTTDWHRPWRASRLVHRPPRPTLAARRR